jgi:tetratricopeptide (TPR) repeat protein
MIRISIALFLLIFCCCRQKNGNSDDHETNIYEKQYKEIYEGYSKESSELTKQKLLSYLETFPEDKNALHFLGRVEYDLGNYKASLNTFKREYLQDTTNVRSIIAMGVSYRLTGNYEEATRLLNKALLKENSRVAIAGLSLTALEKGDTATALSLASLAYSKDSLSPAALIGFADICRRAKQDSIFAVLQPKVEMTFKDNTDVAKIWDGSMPIDRFYGKYKL